MLSWVLSVAAALGIVAGSIFLMPAVTGLLASFFADEIAEEVERRHYPGEPPGHALPVVRARCSQGIKTALLAVLVYLVAMPFLLLAGFGVVIFFLATAFLLSREYFELAAMRFRSPAEARQLRKAQPEHGVHRRTVHRRVRVDPDPQSRDAAVRHRLHGAHAQAAVGPARPPLIERRAIDVAATARISRLVSARGQLTAIQLAAG